VAARTVLYESGAIDQELETCINRYDSQGTDMAPGRIMLIHKVRVVELESSWAL